MKKLFCCDDKFDAVIACLDARHWRRLPYEVRPADKKMVIPADVQLIWANLTSIEFRGVFRRLVNHMSGSNNLSNKALLADILAEHKCEAFLPPTWTPLTQTIPQLITLLSLNSLYCIAAATAGSGSPSAAQSEALRIRRVIDALPAPDAASPHLQLIHQLLDVLTLSDDGPSTALQHVLDVVESAEPWRSYGGRGDVWIVKPVGSSCGRDITVTRGARDTLQVARTLHDFKCIVQKYIERPLLVRSTKKFDIRQWVLVTSLAPLVVFGFGEFYLRLSSSDFTLDDLCEQVHLCNHSIQKTHAAQALTQEEEESNTVNECATMMRQEEFIRGLLDAGHSDGDVRRLLREVKRMCVDTVAAASSRLEKVGQGFEWLGFDLMVTESLDVLLIEVNVSPDISHSTAITSRLVDLATADLFALILDEDGVNATDIASVQSNRRRHVEASESADDDVEAPRWELWRMDSAEKTSVKGNKRGAAREKPDYSNKLLSDSLAAIDELSKS